MVVITAFGILIAIYTGVSLLYQEIDKKTIYTIISKPIERWQFLVGKFAGIMLTMAVEVVIMAVIFLVLLWVRNIEITTTLLQALLLIYVEITIVAAIAMVFGSFSTPFLSGLLTLSFVLLGNLHEAIQGFAESHPSQSMRAVLSAAQMFLPDLTLFNLSTEVTYNTVVPWEQVGWAVAHGGAYTVMLLIGATLIFHRRDFI